MSAWHAIRTIAVATLLLASATSSPLSAQSTGSRARWEAQATAQDLQSTALTLVGQSTELYWQLGYLNQAIATYIQVIGHRPGYISTDQLVGLLNVVMTGAAAK